MSIPPSIGTGRRRGKDETTALDTIDARRDYYLILVVMIFVIKMKILCLTILPDNETVRFYICKLWYEKRYFLSLVNYLKDYNSYLYFRNFMNRQACHIYHTWFLRIYITKVSLYFYAWLTILTSIFHLFFEMDFLFHVCQVISIYFSKE